MSFVQKDADGWAMRNLTIAAVLFIIAAVLFIAAALVADGHLDMGSAIVLEDVGLACVAGGLVAHVYSK